MTTNTSAPSLTLAGPADILAAVPYLVGFHPADSLIVIGLARGQVKVAARWGLPFPPGTLAPLPQLCEREGITRIIVVGYGPGERVTPAVDEARAFAVKAGVKVDEALRAHDGRYWSYVCDVAHCCPPGGTPFDPVASPIAAEATVHGMVALPDRQTLEDTIAPLSGPVRMAMRRATAEAVAGFRAGFAAAADPDAFAREFVAHGLVRVRAALATHAAGGRVDDAEAARLGLDLAVVRVRDEAWTLMEDGHIGLWKDVMRRLEPGFVPPAASLFAMGSWRSGDCVLATIALERVLATHPGYSMANLLMHALRNLLSPGMLRGRMPTPADLDTAMGAARASWLFPLLDLLDGEEQPASELSAEAGQSPPSSRRRRSL
ncbi:DUF4192 domain-containing protein [Nonomuraea cavernae]|uniref:DUF4192 domain-containing protein n=1 Tax=Nonomuraea cavernae TaxID=2045107 RepID=UPI0033F37B0A